MNFRKTIIFWVLIIVAIVWLLPQSFDLKLSNLLYRREKGDTRQLIDTNKIPWVAVGRLRLPNSICTATLINPDIIISARHCFGNKKKPFPIKKIIFQLERNGKFDDIANLSRVYYPSQKKLSRQSGRIKNDYAFATLSKPVDIKKYGIVFPNIATTSAKKGKILLQGGYGANKNKLYGDKCMIIAVNSSFMIQHNCLITFGDSGGPVFYQQGNQWYLAGINNVFQQIALVQNAFAIGPENYYQDLQTYLKQ
ncbi:MAG: trypsin-like serine peptidase [Alphaproteobacteria bacterium]